MSEYRNISHELRARMALERNGFRHSHALGQNFILDEGLIGRLLDAAEVGPSDNVVEIGPGAGVMTAMLSERASEVLAYEVDGKLIPVLEEVLEGRENVRLLHQDFMKANDLSEQLKECFGDDGYRVVANLPYYITTDILLKLVTSERPPEGICIMVQREAADRIMSHPGEKQWCAMAATVRFYGNASVLLEVPPDAFDPPPHVMSCFMRIDRHETPLVTPRDRRLFLKLINTAFAMRRKTLANNMKAAYSMNQAEAAAALEAAGLDPRVRGEALSLEELCRLADVISLDERC